MGKRGLLMMACLLVGLIALAGWQSLEKSGETRQDSRPVDPALLDLKAFWSTYDSATEKRIRGEWPEAARLYREALELNPFHEDSLYYLGNCYFELGDYSQAAQAYRRLVKVNPESNRGHAQLGILLSSPWPGAPVDFEQAERALLKCVRLYPEESGGFVRLGRLALTRGREEEALKYFDQAAGFRSAEAIFWAGFVRFRLGRFREAAELFQQVLEQQRREQRMSAKEIAAEGDTVSVDEHAGPTSPDGRPPRAGGSGSGRRGSPETGRHDREQRGSAPTGAGMASRAGLLQSVALRSRVFLYLSCQRLGGYPPETPQEFRLTPEAVLRSPARVLSVDVGLDPQEVGRGAWADYDGDGDADLALAGPAGRLGLYRNQAGKLQMQSLPPLGLEEAWDVAWEDYDGDGRLDLYLVASGYTGKGRNRLLRQGGERDSAYFEDVTEASGLQGERPTAKALFLDFDGDGRRDLAEAGNSQTGIPALRLYRGLPGNTFRECGREAGISFEGNAVDLASDDYNGDGHPDLLVMRWKRPPILYRNQGDGKFSDVSSSAGLAGLSGDGLAALFLDADRDGHPDLLLTQYPSAGQAMESLVEGQEREEPALGSFRLLRNLDGETFEDATIESGLGLSFSVLDVAKADLDQDGWTDLIVANGSLDGSRLEPSVVLRNQGGTFVLWSYLPDFDHPTQAAGVDTVNVQGDQRPEIYLAGVGLFRMP